ncbi:MULTISPECIES: GNAT family N-acetyltransferase [Actinosynnema]|uniref:GNAT family N-acetyltransferase n=1 Tax=Actinosynnema TaxID=40566 RepID=UPI0020A3C249|nr:GNAT family N-acetyltransferase [Actinosynnema pretiosum]MCP2094140.1 Ribosomal protein S18 acetylase RimI [Actinosynnema pretiosum]
MQVRKALQDESDAVVDLVRRAAADEVVTAWVLDSDEVRNADRTLTDEIIRTLVDEQARRCEVLVAEDERGFAGYAFWTEAGGGTAGGEPPRPDGTPPRAEALFTLLTAARPTFPHLYLAATAVLPERRGQGVGGLLLAHRLADTAGLPCYLEASTTRSAALYARHGFAHAGRPIELPENGPTLFPMLRPATT